MIIRFGTCSVVLNSYEYRTLDGILEKKDIEVSVNLVRYAGGMEGKFKMALAIGDLLEISGICDDCRIKWTRTGKNNNTHVEIEISIDRNREFEDTGVTHVVPMTAEQKRQELRDRGRGPEREKYKTLSERGTLPTVRDPFNATGEPSPKGQT